MSKGNVKKYKKNKGYESISRDMVQDIENLSLQAIGLLSHLISLPDNFEIFKTVLYRRFDKNGRRSVVNAWNELVENNYIIQFKKRTDSGKWEYLYYFSQDKFTENDIEEIEKQEGTKRWQTNIENSKGEKDNHPLYILNSGETVNGNRHIYISNNKDLLINKDIDKDIDTIDTKKHKESNNIFYSKNENKKKYTVDSFYENTDMIPKKLSEMLRAFYGDDIKKAEMIYKKVIIAKNRAESETNSVIALEKDDQLLDLLIKSLSRAIRKTETENISNESGYIYKSVFNTITSEINSRIRSKKHDESGLYYNWLEN